MPKRIRCYSSFHPYFIAEFGRERHIVKPSKVINTPQLHLCWKGNLGMWMPLSQLSDPFLVCLLVCYIRASSQDLSVTLGWHGEDLPSILGQYTVPWSVDLGYVPLCWACPGPARCLLVERWLVRAGAVSPRQSATNLATHCSPAWGPSMSSPPVVCIVSSVLITLQSVKICLNCSSLEPLSYQPL